MFYYYCPHCGYQEEVKELPTGTIPNCRDGYGRAIYHYKCKKCGNLDAGFIRMFLRNMSKKVHLRSIIGLYQGIRGFDNKKED